MSTATLTFEIGTEEIPAFDLAHATTQLPTLTESLLNEARVGYESISAFTTPRRLIVRVDGLARTTDHLHEEHRGPKASIAFDEYGQATKAAHGFARGKGLDVSELETRTVDGVEYLYATQEIQPVAVEQVLPEVLLSIIKGLSWPKSMRWGNHSELFSRPIRWLLALLDSEIIPLSYASVSSGNETSGHRFLSPGPHTIDHANELLPVLEKSFVVVSEAQRKEKILHGVARVEEENKLVCRVPEKTLTEVINLTEYPTIMKGAFEKEFLAVPEEIIVDAMLMHQRYFPLYSPDGVLTNSFIIISNGNPECEDIIVDGNERVVRARLSDAKFFYEEDLKKPLEDYVDNLNELVFQESLGTVKDKTLRLCFLSERLSQGDSFSAEEKADISRAAYLCKADLVTNAVVEFTSVQGIMGCYYALASGENENVAQAIADHYRPKFSGDEPARSRVGQIVAFADKLDTICGLFAVGQAPTGSSDPFALRRNAIGIISMVLGGLDVSLESAIESSLESYDTLDFDRKEVSDEVRAFFIGRIKGIMRDQGHDPHTIDAVLAIGVLEPRKIEGRIKAIEQAQKDDVQLMEDLATAYARANNLRDAALGTNVDESLMNEHEKSLFAVTQNVEKNVSKALVYHDYESALKELSALRTPIDAFFEEVLIMDKDEAVKNNRLKLLNLFVSVFSGVADFGALAKPTK